MCFLPGLQDMPARLLFFKSDVENDFYVPGSKPAMAAAGTFRG